MSDLQGTVTIEESKVQITGVTARVGGGRLSGESSIENYECGRPETNALWHAMRTTSGVLGARFSGAGFGPGLIHSIGCYNIDNTRLIGRDVMSNMPSTFAYQSTVSCASLQR